MAQARQCIKCSGSQESIVIFGVEIDRCPKCGGLWLDGGEIKQLNEQRNARADDKTLEEAIARLAKRDSPGGTPVVQSGEQVVKSTPCPACSGKLTAVLFAGSTIEQCNACHGVFLDKGELQKAMELVDSNEATTIMALAGSVTTSGSIG